MLLYGAYGSNLNLKQMKKRCPNSYPLCFLYLKGWELVFKGVADLERKSNGLCLLGIYEITKICEDSLDVYEEYPHVYKKVKIKKKIEGKVRDIMFYTMSERYKYAVPTIKYFKVIKEGYYNWQGSMKLLKDSCKHSITNHTELGYKSENWQDKKYISKSYIIKNLK